MPRAAAAASCMSAPFSPSRMSRETSTPKRSIPGGSKGRGRDHADARAQRVEQDDIRARDARMQDVAADRHGEALDAALVAADGQRVEQRLRRMLMRAVTRVDHGAVDLLGQQRDRAGRMMTHHQDVGVHRVQGHRGVDQGLALLHRRVADRHVHHVGAEPLAGELERGLRAGRGFEEQVDDSAPAQRGALLLDLAVEIDVFVGEVEQADDVVGQKPFDPQQMTVAEDE